MVAGGRGRRGGGWGGGGGGGEGVGRREEGGEREEVVVGKVGIGFEGSGEGCETRMHGFSVSLYPLFSPSLSLSPVSVSEMHSNKNTEHEPTLPHGR